MLFRDKPAIVQPNVKYIIPVFHGFIQAFGVCGAEVFFRLLLRVVFL